MSNHFDTHRPLVMGTGWMITADHPLAARAGASVLEAGGNAVDAAIAANMVMTVVRPHMCGIGGDLFMLVHSAKDGAFQALNASGRSPAGATIEAFQALGYDKIPETGILTTTVPGVLAGWQAALDRYGSMGFDSLLARALPYAEDGFPVYRELIGAIEERKDLLLKEGPPGEIFIPGGRVPAVGERMRNPLLAKSFRMLMNEGPDAFYKGSLGEALVAYSQRKGGFFSEEDLAEYKITWEKPLTADYRGFTIATQPPNSQGIALLMQAMMLDHFPLADFPPDSPELVHLMVEAKKLAFADRDAYVCDPFFHPVPVDQMLSKDQAHARLALIDRKKSSDGPPPRDFSSGGQDTVYLTVVDRDLNAVSLIQSIYETFGSCSMVPATGMVLHNRGRGFTLDRNHPNRLEPRKRPYHTLHPAMILKDSLPYIVFGTPGADGQTQTNIQLVVAMLDHGADPQQANEAPRWRSNPDGTLMIENRFPDRTLRFLENMGHRLQVLEPYAEIMGSSQAILIDRSNSVLQAGADPRRQAYAIGA
ncbi:MAG TPA: gamma-glutamyltransferase [Desulfobacteraceae bacterium]|nr:gamma-glutamyltransferase [Desulfobacteraceae bacterium]